MNASRLKPIATLLMALGVSMALSTSATAQKASDLPDSHTGDHTHDHSQDHDARKSAEKTVAEKPAIERVRFLLSGYEYFPDRAALDEVGEAAEISTLLRELSADSKERPTLRLRAVDALAYYTDQATKNYLESLIASPDSTGDKVQKRTTRLLRHHAVTSLAKAHGEAALATLEPLLLDDEIQLKMTAISAIGKHMGPSGKQRLQDLRETIDNPVVLRELRKYVKP